MIKRVFLLLTILVLSVGCYRTVETELIYNQDSSKFLSSYDYNDAPEDIKVDTKIVTVSFKNLYGDDLKHFGIRIFSKTKNDSLYISKAVIKGENYFEEFIYNKNVIIKDEIITKNTDSPPMYKGFIGTENLSATKLVNAANNGKMTIEVFYTENEKTEEKSILFPVIHGQFKNYLLPT